MIDTWNQSKIVELFNWFKFITRLNIPESRVMDYENNGCQVVYQILESIYCQHSCTVLSMSIIPNKQIYIYICVYFNTDTMIVKYELI